MIGEKRNNKKSIEQKIDTVSKTDCSRVRDSVMQGSKQADQGWDSMFRVAEAEEGSQTVSIEYEWVFQHTL